MPTGYHDDSNNARYNFVPHPAGSDPERGLPAVGKLVYRTDTGAYEYCTATTPDPTLNGGGTWTPIGGAAWQTFTPVLHSTGTAVNIGTDGFTNGQFARVGLVCHVQVFVSFGSIANGVTAGTGSYYVDLVGLPHRSGSNYIQGVATLSDDSALAQQDAIVSSYPAGVADPRIQFTYTGSPANTVGAAVPWAWSEFDVIQAAFTFRSV